jgi:hypothetical protein
LPEHRARKTPLTIHGFPMFRHQGGEIGDAPLQACDRVGHEIDHSWVPHVNCELGAVSSGKPGRIKSEVFSYK